VSSTVDSSSILCCETNDDGIGADAHEAVDLVRILEVESASVLMGRVAVAARAIMLNKDLIVIFVLFDCLKYNNNKDLVRSRISNTMES